LLDGDTPDDAQSVLERYSSLMNITYYQATDFTVELDPNVRHFDPQSEINQERQVRFQDACMRQLQDEDYSWVTHIASDEYIVVNDQVHADYQLPHVLPTVLEITNHGANRQSSGFFIDALLGLVALCLWCGPG